MLEDVAHLNEADARYLNSADVGELVKWYSFVRDHDGALVVARAGERVRWIFETTQLEKIFPLFATVDEAHASLRECEPGSASEDEPGSPAG